MTAPLMPERARAIVTQVAERHGLLVEDMTAKGQGPTVTAARREAYARLLKHFSSRSIGGWMNRCPDNVKRGAMLYRNFIGVPDTKARTLAKPEPTTVFSLWRGTVPVVRARRSKQEILDQIAFEYGLSTADILGPNQSRVFSVPRQHCMYLMAQQDHLSLPQIGRFLGGRDHTTVLHGVRAHAARIAAEWSGREAA